jgi:hypothetical protein
MCVGRSSLCSFQIGNPKFLAAGVVLALAAAGCAPGVEGGDASDATIGIVSPADGDTVSIPFEVELESGVPLDEPETGNLHAHLYFDTSTDSGDYDIVYGTTWEVTRDLAPGEHTIIAALANPDHSLAGPTQEIQVTVGDDGGVDGAESPAGAPTDPGIDY